MTTQSLHKRRPSIDNESQRKGPLSFIDTQRCAAKAKTVSSIYQAISRSFTPFRFIVCLIAVSLLLFFALPPLIDESLSPWIELKLSVTTLSRAESICINQPRSDIIVTMTTLPKRIEHIDRTIKTILLGNVCPQSILIWVPTYNHRLNATYEFPDWLLETNRTSSIIRVFPVAEDLGPATKLVAALQQRDRFGWSLDQRLLVIDDDVLYSQRLVQTHDCYTSALPNTATGIVGCNLIDRTGGYDPLCNRGERITSPAPATVLFGTASFLTRPKYFNLTVMDTFLTSAPGDAKFEDDWYFSTLMAQQGVHRLVVPIDRRQLVQMDTLWTKRGALIDTDNGDNSHWRAMIDYYRASGGLQVDIDTETNNPQTQPMSMSTLNACLSQR